MPGFFYQIDYTLTEVADDAPICTRSGGAAIPCPIAGAYAARRRRGNGHYVGTYLAWGANNNGWWGEGEIKFYLDGDVEGATICGTGTEDYFGGAWAFEHPVGAYGAYSTPYLGHAAGDYVRRVFPRAAAFRPVPLARPGPDPVP